MHSQIKVRSIINEMCDSLRGLFPQENLDIILFGSYARNEAEDGSDIDVFFLVDASRKTIAERSWQIGEIAADLLMEHGVVVSPVVENREYFNEHVDLLPFYRDIQREGVKIGA